MKKSLNATRHKLETGENLVTSRNVLVEYNSSIFLPG
jgi:hypothetical protein